MKKSKTITESHSGSKQSPAEEPDPVMEADEFVMVSTTDQPEIKEEKKATQISKENEIESKEPSDKTSTGSRKSVHWSPELVSESSATADHSVSVSVFNESNPYIARDPAPESFSTSFREKMDTMKDVIGTWGRKVGEATKRAEDLAEDTWQHFKTSPSLAEAAMGRIAQGTKVLAEGGYEKIFRQTFVTMPEEKLRNSFACYLSTSAGPVMGILYVSTSKLAFCSDTPLSYKNGTLTEWSYYKVIIPLHKLKSVNPSKSRLNSAEKYIQVISVDSHEFWFMAFFNYEGAATCLNEALQVLHSSQCSS